MGEMNTKETRLAVLAGISLGCGNRERGPCYGNGDGKDLLLCMPHAC